MHRRIPLTVVTLACLLLGAATDQPYRIRELGIRDVNDVAIVFGQDIDHGG